MAELSPGYSNGFLPVKLIYLTVAIILLVVWLFSRWYNRRVREEFAFDLLRVMEIGCVWEKYPGTSQVHIDLGGNKAGAKTACGDNLMEPFIQGTVEEGYQVGRRLCRQCQGLARTCCDLSLMGIHTDIDVDED